MKNPKMKIIVATAVLVVAVVCVFGGRAVLNHAAAAGAGDPAVASPPTAAPEGTAGASAAPQFTVPTAIPSTEPAQDAGEPVAGGSLDATVVTDEDGNVTITPDWDAKREGAHIAAKEPTANMGGSGGGSMDLKDGVYQGDHPGATPTPSPVVSPAPSATPTPTPTATPTPTPSVKPTDTPEPAPSPTGKPSEKPQEPTTPSQTPATPTPTPTPSQPSGGGSTPPEYSGHYDGELSPDGKYGWFEGFGWVERGSGSTGVPGSDAGGTDLSGDKVGEM